ncbi:MULTISPECIES: hypothetical protein [unclassified Bradyrhizobium]|uniref:hypothetical protein n=1 Tax=unclassified Bradyrhizobium TaxID=2631580 RepID=UPI001FED3A7F|nr:MULTISPECIES: hypothetical protein [unclassified Bradyrhizobium]
MIKVEPIDGEPIRLREAISKGSAVPFAMLQQTGDSAQSQKRSRSRHPKETCGRRGRAAGETTLQACWMSDGRLAEK